MVAKIEPEWAERLGAHLVARVYSEPHWEKKRASVVAFEKVTLYGVPLVTRRKTAYGAIDPVMSHELFLRHALVEGDWDTHHAFFAANRALLEDVEELEHRARRRDIVVDDQALYDFYDRRVPSEVVSGGHFDAWWKQARRQDPGLLSFRLDELVQGVVDPGDYPSSWRSGELDLPLLYEFAPGSTADGVTVDVPLAVLNRVAPRDFDWQVPGLRLELVTALIRALPKALRVKLVPAPDTARAVLARLAPREESLLPALSREVRHVRDVVIPVDAWDLDAVPDHLRVTYRVVDEGGAALAEGKDLGELQAQLALPLQEVISSVARDLERSGLTTWEVASIPRTVSAGAVVGYPALVDEGASVALRVLGTPADQAAAHPAGVRRLLLLTSPSPVKAVRGRLTNASKLALQRNPHGSVGALLADCLTAAADGLVGGAQVWDAEDFAVLVASVRPRLEVAFADALARTEKVLVAAAEVEQRLAVSSEREVRAQLDDLVHPGFVTEVGVARLPDLVRYLQAAAIRLDRLPREAARDRVHAGRVREVQLEWERMPAGDRRDRVRWMLEELRVSLFAPTVKAKGPISEQRIYKVLDEVLT